MRYSLLFFMLLGFAGCNPGAAPPPIVVGHVSDKTRLDKAGEQAELGIRLALHDLDNEKPLADVFAGHSIWVHHTDTRGNLDAFESEAIRLDSVNRAVALLGGLSMPETMALSNAKLPLLSFSGQPATGAGSYVFYLGMAPARQGAVLAKVVAENAKVQQVVLVQDERRSETTAFAVAFQKTLAEACKEAKTKEPALVTVPFGKDPNWHDVTERMLTSQTQSLVFAGSVQDFNACLKVCRGAFDLSKTQIIFAGKDGDQYRFDLEGDTKTSILLATAFYADPASDKIQAFLKAYREMPEHVEADVHSALAYDGFRMLVEAMKRTPTQLTPDKLRDELLKTKDFEGLTGKLSITEDRQVLRPLFVMRWQNGAMTLVKKFPVEK